MWVSHQEVSVSIMNLGRGNANESVSAKAGKRVDPAPASQPPGPADSTAASTEQQLQLGSAALEAVDRLTGMSGDEIERVAEQLLEGADETAGVLRELARRVRENGVFANDRLARFVRVANQCADIARTLQQNVERRDEQPAPQPVRAEPPPAEDKSVAQIDDAPALAADQESPPS
jgi:hypothetical protein